MKRATLMLAALTLLGGVGPARADYIANVTLDTSALTKNPSQGPFSVSFQLLNPAPPFVNNNTATISNFNLHGGSLGTFINGGGFTGDLSSTLTITKRQRSRGLLRTAVHARQHDA
jgi:hypothetical protein